MRPGCETKRGALIESMEVIAMAGKPTYEALEQQITLLESESAQRKRFEEINHSLFKISNAVNMTSSLDELFRTIHLALSPVIDTTNFFIALYDKSKDSVTFPYCVDSVDECYPPVIEVSRTASLTAEVIRTGRPVLVTKAEILAQRAKSSFKIPGCTPSEIWLGVPLKTRDEIIGVMAVQSYHDPMCYDQTDTDVMVSVADHVAIAVERKKAEEALRESNRFLRATLDALSANIALLDEQGLILLVNNAWRDFAAQNGILTENVSEGRNYLDVCDHANGTNTEEAIPFADGIRAVLAGAVESFMLEYPCHSPNEDRWFIGRVTPFPGVGPRRVVVAHENITERKRLEKEQLRLEMRLLKLEKTESLGRMAGAIAHHFNNQLQVVMGNLEMAMDDLPRGMDTLGTMTEAMKASRKAAAVSTLMLTYLGQTPGNQEPMDLSEVCRQSLPLLQTTAPKGTILQAVFPASGPIIRANTGQIQQILTHLVTNAWEAISGNQDTIALTVKMVSHADIPTSKRFPIDWQPHEIAYACLEVSDTGHGISDRDIEKLFDPFFTTKFTGRGLGLPVVMGIVKAHGGGVTVESEPGRGSTFRIFLPVSNEELPCRIDLPAISGALQTGKAEKISKTEGSGTVLLIEDEEQVRKMAGIMLTRLGYTVLEAKDGVDAMEVFQQHQGEIRCVLSDLTMPRMDGWDTLTALRILSPKIPVILSSGYDEAQVMAGEHSERPNAFLGKPYQRKGLSETIRRVLADNKIGESENPKKGE